MLPSSFEVIYGLIMNEIEEKGLTNILLMVDDDGKINYYSVTLLYASAGLILLTMFYVLKEAKNEL